MFDPSTFWPAFRAAGMLTFATLKQKGGAVDVWVGFNRPDRPRFDGTSRSHDYEIEYQHADAPRLAEGDAVTLWTDATKASGTKYVVREEPFVSEVDGTDGFFRHALLTAVK